MTDSMNFGPDWIRNLSSEGNTSGGTITNTRYQLADFRYGREEMLALFDRNVRPPASLSNFKSLYSDATLVPLALTPTTDEERVWQNRPANISGPPRGRGGSLERGGGRVGRGGRGGYQSYCRPSGGYEGGWGSNGEQAGGEWGTSPRKDFGGGPRTSSVDNWRRARGPNTGEDDDGWRNVTSGRNHDKWVRSTSWRGDGEQEERGGPPERGGRASWHETRGPPARRSWDNEDHLPEWATEHPTEGGGTFDERGAFHGSDDETMEGRTPHKRESGLQKSSSQQHITNKSHPPLPSSKSAMSLSKPPDFDNRKEEVMEESIKTENGTIEREREREKSVPNIMENVEKEQLVERAKSEGPPKLQERTEISAPQAQAPLNRVEEDFERLQEDFVLKLVENEEPIQPMSAQGNFEVPPPPNLTLPSQDKWCYQDPQGKKQGPFTNMEMAEWYKAGYFNNSLKVRRECDERFFLLGELIAICGPVNPFQSALRLPVLRNEPPKMPDQEMMQQFQYLSQYAAFKQAQQRVLQEPWNALTVQQQEITAQRLLQQQPVPQDLSFMQQPQPSNPLMQMIKQMQHANKLPGMVDKPPTTTIDPHLQMHVNNMLLQNRMQPSPLTNHLPTGTLPGSLGADGLSTGLAGLNPNVMPIPGMAPSLPAGLGMNLSRPNDPNQDNDPLRNLLKQLQKSQTPDVNSLWPQNQFSVPNPPPNQWQPPSEPPMSMWDVQQTTSGVAQETEQINNASPPLNSQQVPIVMKQEREQISPPHQQQQQKKEESQIKESKKKKEQEEKLAKKEAEEKRKAEQKKQELEKKMAEEKKRKEEERIKKELEKAKKEAEEKRMKELEEKRRLKEQRKAEEYAKKRNEEMKKQEDNRLKREAKEQEERKQAEEKRLAQEQVRLAKAAPWLQSGMSVGMNLTDIQKAEKEKRAQEAALKQQRQMIEQQIQSQQQEKTSALQFNWAKKPVEQRKVKSLSEIQAEEQESLAKQAAEARLQKEREAPVVTNTNSIWSSQNLTWASTAASGPQWNMEGFWDDKPKKQQQQQTSRPSTAVQQQKSSNIAAQQQVKPKQKKKEEQAQPAKINNNNGSNVDEFTSWCYKSLSNMSTNIDIPTFVTFLRDIESAFDVREYCKEYLGENGATQQFASNFLEKRRSFKPKSNAHKDDMCMPAPAITPSTQHSNEFQEVKVRGKTRKIKNRKC